MKRGIMLDIETLGQKPGSVIAAIGAVSFNAAGEIAPQHFYQRIKIQSCLDAGLVMDWSTVQWWMNKSEAARKELCDGNVTLDHSLYALNQWLKDVFGNFGNEEFDVWGNGSDFDNALVKAAYEATNIPLPWKYFQNRCYRTLKSLFPEIKISTGESGAAHIAVDDARALAEHLVQILKRLETDPLKIIELIIAHMKDSSHWVIEGIVSEVTGKQQEDELFGHIFVDQSSGGGLSGDDFNGHIYFPAGKFYIKCWYQS